jgi:hypothetical protein
MMTDNIRKPVEGHFRLEIIDKTGKILEVVDEQNMIMKQSRRTVAHSTAGHTNYDTYINKFVLGTRGHVQGNILEPKDFDYDRNLLFSQEEGAYYYPITFDPGNRNASTGECVVVDEGYEVASNPAEFSKVYLRLLDDESTLEYTIEIPLANANGSSGITAYTEAALFTIEDEDLTTSPKKLGRIFAMRTFPAKIKEDEVKFRIIWKIIF